MSKFKIELKEQNAYGTKVRQFFKVTLKNGKPNISFDDVRQVTKDLEDSYKDKGRDDLQFMVRGLNIQRMRTLKGFNSDFDEERFDDYYSADVDNPDKFTKFSQLQITVFYENNESMFQKKKK